MGSGYQPISDYAVIGNLRTVALVARDGSIDWCCLPNLDSPSVFGAILDSQRGGRFRVGLPRGARNGQKYMGYSNVVTSTMHSGEARLDVTDFFPLSGDVSVGGKFQAPDEIHRILECNVAPVDVEVEWSPRFDYGRTTVSIEKADGRWTATDGAHAMSLGGLGDGDEALVHDGGGTLKALLRMKAGEKRALVARWGKADAKASIDESSRSLIETLDAWRRWVHAAETAEKNAWAGEAVHLVMRSELVMKLLSNAETGAIAAAATTSLPEVIGGSRNWDYRYSWIRDSSMTAQALVSLGHEDEAVAFLDWCEKVSAAADPKAWNLQIMYGLHGEPDLKEEELPHMEGYRKSPPVRIGNAAFQQFQLEVYGELINTAYELIRRGRRLGPRIRNFVSRVADHVVGVWRRPDYGIWEVRGEPRHFTYSKIMAWVALDRALQIHRRAKLPGKVETWQRTMEEIRAQVLEQGYDASRNAFVQSYGSKALDAANLRIALVEFLPYDDPRVQGTIDRTLEELTQDGLVRRYMTEDGLPGEEGAFGLCSFWLVDALALSGRVAEAHDIFWKVAGRANHVGLFSEQFVPATGEFLGNFPQAFTHIGLINSAIYLAYAERRRLPEYPLVGTSEHKAAEEAPCPVQEDEPL